MSNTPAESSATANGERYFDLHTTGVGYLNRVRKVPVKKGEFLAVDISALRGAADSVEYTRFDCRVSGKEAQDVVRNFEQQIKAGCKVLVGFKIGDLYAETFVYENGEKKGQTGISLKAHLLHIAWAKVNGSTVYNGLRENSAPPDEAQIAEHIDAAT